MGEIEQIVQHYRLEDVELEITLAAAEGDRVVVAENLHGNHGQSFALRRVDFAGHDGGAWLVFRNQKFADAGARAGGVPAHVIGNFHGRTCEDAQGSGGGDHAVMRREGGEFVGGGDEGLAGFPRHELGDRGTEIRMRVQAGAEAVPPMASS